MTAGSRSRKHHHCFVCQERSEGVLIVNINQAALGDEGSSPMSSKAAKILQVPWSVS